MSIYDILEKISNVTKVHYKKTYNPHFVVAKFYINDKEIKYYYSDYSKEVLECHIKSPKYSKKLVDINFWDPRFCKPENLTNKDIVDVLNRVNISYYRESSSKDSEIVCGYLVTLLGVYNMIYKSYNDPNHHKDIQNIVFDKNILRSVLNCVDIVVDYNHSMITLIKSLYNDDNILSFLITPSGKFRLTVRDISFILKDTPRVHEISQTIYSTVKDDILCLQYFKELLSVCGKIYSPRAISSCNAEDVLFNILKLDINLDLYEKKIIELLDLYIDKGGNLDIDINLDLTKRYENILPILDNFKEYRLS